MKKISPNEGCSRRVVHTYTHSMCSPSLGLNRTVCVCQFLHQLPSPSRACSQAARDAALRAATSHPVSCRAFAPLNHTLTRSAAESAEALESLAETRRASLPSPPATLRSSFKQQQHSVLAFHSFVQGSSALIHKLFPVRLRESLGR